MGKKIKIIILITAVIFLLLFFLSLDYSPTEKLTYGVSFSRFHTDELGLDWKETYLAILNDLGVRNFRFSAHWPLTEPEDGKYNFNELDFQVREAQKVGASVILAVGRRLPGWPECHEPEWTKVEGGKFKVESEKNKFKQEKILKYTETVVNRYKGYDNIKYWQVENEPYLTFFSRSTCGSLDETFLDKEITLIKKLDPTRPILITDSGEFGLWFKAYRRGDVFGTSLYLYIWNRTIGSFRYPITPSFFRIKHNLVKIILGEKPAIVVELSAEPWLLQPIINTPIETQLERMGIDKFNEVIEFSSKTGFDTFYLWGAEWWYWMKLKEHGEFWSRAKDLFGAVQ
ncbi:MAG: beta-galactosidase [bacterium]|nr:beta-galactosidase [bacterium]